MKATFLPKTSFGKKSLILFAVFFVFMIISNVASMLWQNEADGITTIDRVIRPFVIASGILGMLSGLSGFALAVLAIIKQKERAILIYSPIILGVGLLFLLIGEFVVPH